LLLDVPAAAGACACRLCSCTVASSGGGSGGASAFAWDLQPHGSMQIAPGLNYVAVSHLLGDSTGGGGRAAAAAAAPLLLRLGADCGGGGAPCGLGPELLIGRGGDGSARWVAGGGAAGPQPAGTEPGARAAAPLRVWLARAAFTAANVAGGGALLRRLRPRG
ncbi:MAG: hypothetical protein J3K34DRAFT_505186, partial [Monoraphidium minutum]